MISAVNPQIQSALQSGQLGGSLTGGIAAPTEGAENFGQMLKDALNDVNKSQNDSAQLQNDFMTGRKPVEVHDVMIAMEKASTAMQLTMAVRNKVLDAYQEISRMQV